MNIVAYTQLGRTRNPTGVGKHIMFMTAALARHPAVRMELFAAHDQLTATGRAPAHSMLSALPVRSHPWAQRPLELAWLLGDFPDVSGLLKDADWLYCPSEVHIPVRRSRLAVTCHAPEVPRHDSPATMRARALWRFRIWRICNSADVVLTVSEFAKQRLVELVGCRPEKIAVVGNGVERDYYAVAGQPRRHDDRPYLLVVGGLTSRKSGHLILQLAKLLERKQPDLSIVVAGECEDVFAEARGAPNVTLLGYTGVDRLPHLMRNAVAMVFPSRYESFGMPVLEAMAAGTPAIVSDWAALPEVAGAAGIIVPGGDPEGMADWAVRLLEDEALRDRYAAAGRRRAAGFTWEACAERVAAALGVEQPAALHA